MTKLSADGCVGVKSEANIASVGSLQAGPVQKPNRGRAIRRSLEVIEEDLTACAEAKSSASQSHCVRSATPPRLCPGQETDDVLSGLPEQAARRMSGSEAAAEKKAEEHVPLFHDDECPLPRFLWSAYAAPMEGAR
eukprot:gb/GFBE01024033.1/.p1 GENE.gb/GFBE01024033.1/~~gb/GFBE01024033.1/.p1  ORF type:complete len:136 (+),score=27.07 gb/GFBE01024033.1/:1-408(+)